MTWTHNDGGREAAGYKGTTGDCVCRSIAIATERSYQEIYDPVKKRGVLSVVMESPIPALVYIDQP